MRDKEFVDLSDAYKQIYEHVDVHLENSVDSEIEVYDEVMEYLLGEGYSLEESTQIMVELINEGGWGLALKGLQGAAKFIQRRASTPLKTAVTDLATTAIASSSTPAAKLSTATARTVAPSPIVRTVKAPTMRTSPRGSNISPDPWKQVSGTGNRLKEIIKGNTPKPTSQRALSGSQTPAALPSGIKGGQLVKATSKPSSITPAAKPGSLARTNAKPSSITPAAKPTTGTLSSTRIEPVNVRDVTASTRSLPGSPNKPALPSGRSQQFKDIQKLTKSTGGGLMGTTKPTNLEPRAPKPAWGSGAKPAITAKPSPVDKTIPSTSSKPALKPAAKPSGGSVDIPKSSKGLKRLGATVAGAAALGVGADMAFPRSTAPGTPDKAPKFPTTAKEVKKGQTYYDPNTRVGTSQRFAQRKKVGPAKIGSSFEDAFKFYRKSGAKEFTYAGKKYTTQLAKEQFVYNYLIDEGFASDEKSAQAIAGAMSEEWVQSIVEAVTGGSAPQIPASVVKFVDELPTMIQGALKPKSSSSAKPSPKKPK